jgi:hypothetical protein
MLFAGSHQYCAIKYYQETTQHCTFRYTELYLRVVSVRCYSRNNFGFLFSKRDNRAAVPDDLEVLSRSPGVDVDL